MITIVYLKRVVLSFTFNFRSFESNVHKEGPYHWAGKQFLSDLNEATQYRARVRAENEEGWGQFGEEWHFATLGAEPSPVTGSAETFSSCMLIMLSCLLFLRRI